MRQYELMRMVARLREMGFRLETFEHNANSDGSGATVSSVMAYIPKITTSGWPQSAHNGIKVGGFWLDAYEASQPDASDTSPGTTTLNAPGTVAACSSANKVPWASISWLNARIAASNRIINGRPCHMVTPFERFAALSLVMKSGLWGQLRGNNNSGKDTRDPAEAAYYGTADPTVSGRCLTGTGPSTWYHNLEVALGIHNLVANTYEWENCRIESGFIQPKAYLAGAASYGQAYIDYDDNAGGDGVDICHLTPGTYTITDAVNGNEDVVVEKVIITGRFTGRVILASGLSASHGDNCVIQLKTAIDLCNGVTTGWSAIGKLLEGADSKQMALPDFSDTSTHYATYLDSAYKYDNNDSRALQRCGYWGTGSNARSGLLVPTSAHPTNSSTRISFRAALSDGDL
ncbi:hypothetical protein [Desulfotignum balticum]|uniref:hypothetical protein n=1 Tax=Desulfotignum balticum TaxID=115781 RepID=UPI00041EC3B3|nr:hypothetical protein [Desulfotignum balticum]